MVHHTIVWPHIVNTLFTANALFMASQLVASEIADTKSSHHAKVRAIGLSEVHWTSGFWAERFATCRDSSLPAMWELMKGTEYKPFYQHFLIASGELTGEHHGAAWNDGDFYKWIEAACSVLAVTQDPELSQIVDQCVAAIGRCQRDDGYLHTPVLIRNRNGDQTAQPFQDRDHFEMYNMGHLITAACVHHRVTGTDDFLNVARKTADFLERTFAQPTTDLARNSVCPSHYMAIIELYRTTHDSRYLRLAQELMEMRSLVRNGTDDNQDRIPFAEQREASGHAVRANYLYAGAADLFLETGDPKLWTTLEAVWTNVTTKKMYITGGCGALYDGASPDGSAQQSDIARVHQAYGRNYQLPSMTAHNETCAAIGSVLWNWRMFLATGEGQYIDTLELALCNSVLSGVSLDGTKYFYVNPLRNEHPLPTELRWSRTRVPFVTSYCCPPNLVRTVAQVNGYAYAKEDDAILVNLYGGNNLATHLLGQQFEMTQETRYPWDGAVRFTIGKSPNQEVSLKLRIPGWAKEVRLSLNGVEIDAEPISSGYAVIRRKWEPTDRVSIEFPMPVQLIESHPLVEETRNQVAVKRGPIVYCLESKDLPDHVRVRDVAVRPTTSFRPVRDPQLLDGVTTLNASLLHQKAPNWSSTLYRPWQRSERSTLSARLVPYFAWCNRGEAEMSVWLPLASE